MMVSLAALLIYLSNLVRDRFEQVTLGYAKRLLLRAFAVACSLIVSVILIIIGVLLVTDTKVTWLGGAIYIAVGLALPLVVLVAVVLPWGAIHGSVRPRLTFASDFEVQDLESSEESKFQYFRKLALQHLEDIRYQQTYTSGWSGTLTAPVIGAALSGSQSVVRQPMSYPEVVSEMRGFLSEVAIGFRPIVVGIDELDKMESGEQARKFLNDIKGVFGVNNCYFLVSVSIDAMSSFERRGMPFRDAFDSSFDEILTVSALTYKDASAIINRRVIGVSNQFIALAYVISGGIARDLIRAMRKLVTLANTDDNDEHKESHNNKTLQSLSARLVGGEVTAKLAAVGIALQNDIGSEWKDQILCVARKLNPDDENSLLEAARKLRVAAHPTHGSDRTSAELASDLAVYLYFAATVIRYFNDSLDEQQLKMAEDSGLLEGLARCRQKFVMGAAEAWREIDDCRTACHLDTLPFLTTQAALRPV